jgi:hypothetical protein
MQAVDTTQSVTLGILAEDWRRSLVAANMSPKTVNTYMEAVTGPDRFLLERGMPRAADAITREHFDAYITDLLEVRVPGRLDRAATAAGDPNLSGTGLDRHRVACWGC